MPRLPATIAGGTTGVGSLPHRMPADAVQLSLLADLPYWPQLPQRHPNEGMLNQYAAPGAPTMPDRAAGLYALAEALQDQRRPLLKGQITGPITQIADPEQWQPTAQRLAAKAVWQVNWLKRWADQVLIVIDEPTLGDVEDTDWLLALEALRTLTDALRRAGAAVGLHCCGPADWERLQPVGWDVLSFDIARRPSLSLLARHVRQGGLLVWGCVPTQGTPDVSSAADALRTRWHAGALAPDQWHAASLISPTCGLGTLSLAHAEQVVHATALVSAALQREMGLRASLL